MILIDPTLPEDVRVLIKAAYYLTTKATPRFEGHLQGQKTSYQVPVRELERVRSKVAKLVEVSHG